MKWLLLTSLVLLAVLFGTISNLPSVSALPVSYNTTSINLGMTSVPRNSSSYDVFTLNQDNWLWEKFNNNTIDSGPLSVAGTITYNTNLKALWKFENTLTDSSTSGKTLTKVAGTTTYTTSAEEGSGLVLDGSTYYTASDATLPTGTNPISVTGWVNFGSFASFPMYFAYGTSGAHTLFAVYVNGGIVTFYDGTTSTAISTTSLSLNTWYYLTITYDGANARVYINGVLDKTTAITVNTVLSGASGITVGALPGGGGNKVTGKLDELRVYSGTALTLAQHQALYMVGHYSQSHTFDGGEYVTIQNQYFSNTSPFTVTSWIKTPSLTSTPEFYSVLSGGNGILNFISTTGKLSSQIRWAGGASSSTVTGVSTIISDGNYHYIAVTYDGSSNISGIKLYVDGILDQTGSSTSIGSFTSSGNGFIGIDPGLAGDQLTGQLDNLKVYPYALTASQINSDYNSISPISSGKQFMSWYNGISGSATLTKKLGDGQSTITTACNLNNVNPVIISNVTNIYYICTATNLVKQVPIQTGTSVTYYGFSTPSGVNNKYLFSTMQNILSIQSSGTGFASILSTKSANTSTGLTPTSWQVTNQKISTSTSGLKYNMNTTTLQTVSTNACEINYKPTNTTKVIDSIACDQSIPAMAIKYWNGFMIQKVANYGTNTTQQFLSSIDNSAYKKLLSLPCLILVNETPCVDFIATDFSGNDYFVVLTSTHVYYKNAQTALTYLNTHNYAFQSYDVITTATDSSYPIQNPILQSMTLYGFNLNTTISKAGLFTLPSGYSVRTTTVSPSIRLIDPQWTDDTTDIPIISTTGSLFPIYLTVSNAPAFSAIKVTQGNQLINNLESVWSVAQLDSTRSVEFDLPSGTCANVYIADISVSPSIWNFQGIICATGVNQKTMAYTNTLPINFWSLPYGVTHTYQPTNNGLTTSFHSTQSPVTYTVVVKNSTGTIALNSTFVLPANQTLQTESFNVSSVTKPAGLFVYVGGNMVYSAYLGSALSLASVTSFFNQYFTYQGFNLIAFVPIIFASMFTRNTIGIGVVLTVIFIATLSWLSIIVIPDAYIFVMAFIGILSLLAYRIYYG